MGEINRAGAETASDTGTSPAGVLRFAGAFCAWIIGSGFATGQEILQFVTSYGMMSFPSMAVLAAGFALMGFTITLTGYRFRQKEGFRHFSYFCGDKLGAVYNWSVPVIQIVPLSILLSGGGATLHEYYGLNHTLGVLIMALAVLVTFYAGFDRLVSVVGMVGPVIIVFTLLVGCVTLVRDMGKFPEIPGFQGCLIPKQPSSSWLWSSVLYISMNFFCGSVFYTELGQSARSRKEVIWGTGAGVAALIVAIAIISTAMLLNGPATALRDIPTLYLAKRVAEPVGALFSVILVLGIFSSACTGFYVVVSLLSKNIRPIREHQKAAAFLVIAIAFTIGVFSFGNLISIFYPINGFLGIMFALAVARRCIIYIISRNKARA